MIVFDIIVSVASAALISIFIQNSIYERALGTNILLYASRERGKVIGFSLMVTYVSTVSSVFVWLLDILLGDLPWAGIIRPFFYILIISAVYIVSLVLMWRFLPKAFAAVKPYVHLSVFNCSVLGGMYLNTVNSSDLATYIGFGFGTGVGFFLAGWLLYIAYGRLTSNLVPAAFRGMPVMFVYVGMLSLALYAFVGYSTTL